MNPALEFRTIIRGAASSKAVVLEASGATALVSTAGGQARVAADIAVAVGDVVTVRAGRIVSKRTGGEGGAVKVYHV